MSFETIFTLAGDLIVVDAVLTGRRSSTPRRFVLDTGAALTTIGHDLADAIGYTARDAIQRTRVRSAVGEEHGYMLRVAELSALGVTMPSCLVNVFDLGYDIDGLLGMNFLSALNVEIRPAERRIIVAPIAPTAA